MKPSEMTIVPMGKNHVAAVAALEEDISELENSMPRFAVGTYTGTGAATAGTTVDLGFRPAAVLIVAAGTWSGSHSIFITEDAPHMYMEKPLAIITDTGFQVSSALYDGTSFVTPNLNADRVYAYIAFA